MNANDPRGAGPPIGRRAFLRKLGALAAIGVGAAVVPAAGRTEARPRTPTVCCPNQSACGTCPNGTIGLFCSGGGCGGCCVCANGVCVSSSNCPC